MPGVDRVIRHFRPIESAILRECAIPNSPLRSTCTNTPDFIDRERMPSWTAYCSPGDHGMRGPQRPQRIVWRCEHRRPGIAGVRGTGGRAGAAARARRKRNAATDRRCRAALAGDSGVIDRLQHMDVTVYVRTRVFATLDLDGRVALVSVRGVHRYLLIELACGRSELTQMVTLAHELFHAIEIAAEPSVVSADT